MPPAGVVNVRGIEPVHQGWRKPPRGGGLSASRWRLEWHGTLATWVLIDRHTGELRPFESASAAAAFLRAPGGES